jgi:RNA polymerase sigma-70 factor (ECF subfamily)
MERAVHDNDLAAALAVDLDGSFERLVLTYQDRIYAFALRCSGCPEDGEEIAQDTFVRAYQALTCYPADLVQRLALQPWLYKIALNVFRNRIRGRNLRFVPLDSVDYPAVNDEDRQPESRLEHAERRAELATLLAALPPRYRISVILRHVEGLSYSEIAAILNQPVGTVKSNVHRGIQLLREALTTHSDSSGVTI